MLKTFHEWSQAGYKIKKGSKAKGRTSNGFLFDTSQVVYSPRSYNYYAEDWDGIPDGGDSMGFDISQYGDR